MENLRILERNGRGRTLKELIEQVGISFASCDSILTGNLGIFQSFPQSLANNGTPQLQRPTPTQPLATFLVSLNENVLRGRNFDTRQNSEIPGVTVLGLT